MNRAETADRLTEEVRQSPTLQAAVAQLLEALRLAESSRRPPKEFAVELPGLIHGGTTAPALRWMVISHLAQHHAAGGQLKSDASDGPRLEFTDHSRFTLTKQGLAIAEALVPANGRHAPRRRTPRPRWDAFTLELRFEGRLVKCLSCRASNQNLVLTAFEELGWPARIDDPLPGSDGDPQKRRINTVQRLNKDQAPLILQFHTDGEGFRWEVA